jgi:hypothetical protein
MPNIVTNKFKISNAKSFLDSYTVSGENTLYMFLAKPDPWGVDDFPPTPVDAQQNHSKTWDEIVSLKRIIPTNMVNVIKRINWATQTVYSEYDHEDTKLLTKNFYVINRDLDVYKCIDNVGGSASTVEPTGKSLNIFTTSDGYKWKYLYTVSTSDKLKFLTDNWMPVRTNPDVATVAKDGAVENIKIYNGGLDYSIYSTVTIDGDGASANILAKQNLGVIYDFVYTNTGSKYRFANAYISDSQGAGRLANIKAILSPVNGHGYDPVLELGAYYVMLNVKAEYNEGYGDFPTGFSFRKVGIVKNPMQTGNVLANAATLSGLVGINVSNVNGTFINNEYLVGITSKANAYTVTSNVVSGNGYIRYIQSFGTTENYKPFTIGEAVIGRTSGATAIVTQSLLSEVMQDTGEILYLENREPVTRTIDQTDNLHLVIEF